ncbi:monooxygenase 1 [Quercus suber]|uniref:Monooxygenase 1 n=1 Tax=Quercus suber TaxID=58331 RepID=A0AAW0L628_QUESU
MVKNSDLESLSIARLRYLAPWDVLRGSFRKGIVAVVGDAMHVVGPFLGQGGSAAIEDAIVLARCFARNMHGGQVIEHKVGEAMDEYVKERRMRLVWLSTQTYLVGLLVKKSPWLVRFVCNILMMVFFSDSSAHTRWWYLPKTHGHHLLGEAMDEYVKERRMRLVWLSTQTYLVGLLVKKSPWLVRFVCNILMMVFFSDSSAHTRYDCGCL